MVTSKQPPVIQRIDAIIREPIRALGFEIVQIRMLAPFGKQSLQIMAEPNGGEREMTVEDCAKISRHVSALLDVEDPISGAYNLEVSSPGIDRPLISVKDFEKYIGHQAKVEMAWPVDGRKRFNGTIAEVKGDDVLLRLDAKHEAVLNIEGMSHAKLQLTDELIKAHQKKYAAAEPNEGWQQGKEIDETEIKTKHKGKK